MAYAYDEQKQDQVENQDQDKQDATILTQTSGDIGAEPFQATGSGSSDRPRDAVRSANVGTSQVINRNLGKAANPFQFSQTRQALEGSKQQVKTEADQYLQNAITPYQYGAPQTQAVQNWARGTDKTAQPAWMQSFQQGTPQALTPFESKAQTDFAPVKAMQTNAGVRSYLRDPNDPESRSGEQAVDFSILNANPEFNLNREATLKDYDALLKTKGDIEANIGADSRKAQIDAFNLFKTGITKTLDDEAKAIQDAAIAEETAYDKGFGNTDKMMSDVLNREMADLAANSPENLRNSFFNPTGRTSEFSKYFKPLNAESTKAEDFLSEEGAGNFNRIMAALGRGGNIATKGRYAGAKGPGEEALGFDRQGFRDEMFNRAIADANRPSPFANAGAYDAGGASFDVPPPPAPAAPQPASSPGQGFGEERVMNEWDKIGDFFSNMGTFNPDVKLPTFQGASGYGFSHGGRVPGIALTEGDSPANDVVDAQVSPGEIIIPRSAAGDKESAKQFIDNMPFSKTRELLKNKYNCGGMVEQKYNCGGMVQKNYNKGGR